MNYRYPFGYDRYDGSRDQPPRPDTFIIHNSFGNWVLFDGLTFALPVDQIGSEGLVKKVTAMLNAAYEQGGEDAKRAVREALRL